MVKEWLTNRITPEECETKHLVRDERLGPSSVPFGFQHRKWLEFKSGIQKGDALWEFSSPPDTWAHLRGRAGICIVRNGEIIDSMVTAMN